MTYQQLKKQADIVSRMRLLDVDIPDIDTLIEREVDLEFDKYAPYLLYLIKLTDFDADDETIKVRNYMIELISEYTDDFPDNGWKELSEILKIRQIK